MFYQLLTLKDAIITAAFIVPILYSSIDSLDSILGAFVELDRHEDYLKTISEKHNKNDEIYDFVIVGAGSAGCVLANRLTENPDVRVLLLDAGGEPSPLMSIPTIGYLLNTQTSIDWAYKTVPQTKAAFGLNNNQVNWPAGKTLGGSSSIHGMIYIRGNTQGFSKVAHRTQDSIWNFQNIMRLYHKVENYRGVFDPRDHGHQGQLPIESSTLAQMADVLLAAGVELGYKIRDPNPTGPYTEGFAPIEFYKNFVRRGDAYHSSIAPIAELRPNLIIRKFSFVTNLRFRPNSNHASGVDYERHGKYYSALAKKEVILCAGALSTPKLLMLSGIGPKNHLAYHNIPVRVNSAVGLGLSDKYGAHVGPFFVPPHFSFNTDKDINMSSVTQWLVHGNGLLGSGRTEATYALLTDYAKTRGDTFAPDIHTYVISGSTKEGSLSALTRITNANVGWSEYFRSTIGRGESFHQLVTLNNGKGLGYVKLRDKNPYSPLIIDPKYLHDERDVNSLVEGIKFAVKLVEETAAFRSIGAHYHKALLPGCENFKFKSNPYFRCLARHSTLTAFKYGGTAFLGHKNDPTAVVDSRFRVKGTSGLRVIDGSLFRENEVSTNDVTVRMIAELGAEVIKSYYKL